MFTKGGVVEGVEGHTFVDWGAWSGVWVGDARGDGVGVALGAVGPGGGGECVGPLAKVEPCRVASSSFFSCDLDLGGDVGFRVGRVR